MSSKIILPTIELRRIGVTEYFAIQSSSMLGNEYSESIYIKVGRNTLDGKFVIQGASESFPLEADETVVYNFTYNRIEVVNENTTQVVPLTREFKIDMGFFDMDWVDKNRDFTRL